MDQHSSVGPRCSCIIVDDDPGVRAVLQLLLLRRLRLEMREFASVQDVVTACGRNAPSLIFLEVELRAFRAIDMIRALDREEFRGAIQLMGAHHSLLEPQRAFGEQLGLAVLPPLTKPFRAAQIEQIVRRYVD